MKIFWSLIGVAVVVTGLLLVGGESEGGVPAGDVGEPVVVSSPVASEPDSGERLPSDPDVPEQVAIEPPVRESSPDVEPEAVATTIEQVPQDVMTIASDIASVGQSDSPLTGDAPGDVLAVDAETVVAAFAAEELGREAVEERGLAAAGAEGGPEDAPSEVSVTDVRVMAEAEGSGQEAVASHSSEAQQASTSAQVLSGAGTKDEPYQLSWDVLLSAKATYDPRNGKEEIPASIEALNGKWVAISGYSLFPQANSQPRELLIMLNAWDGCCIGVPPSPYDAVEVTLARSVSEERFAQTGKVVGRLNVDPYLVGEWLIGLYTISDAEFAVEG